MNRRLLLAGLLGVSACAPLSQHALVPPGGFGGPRLEPDALVSFDGATLPMTVWPALGGEPWAVIVGLHGMNDYAEAFSLAAPYWAKDGITTYAYDQRGFGRGPQKGVWGGEALMQEDLRTAVALARQVHPKAIIAVVGESMGGAVAITAFASDRPPAADRLILTAPAVWGWSAQPIPYRAALWLGAHLRPGYPLGTPIWVARRVHASDNIEILRKMGRDPNMIFDTRIDAIYGLVSLMQHAREDVRDVKAPTLYLYGAHDELIPKHAAFYAAAQLKPTDRSAYYAHGWHLLTRDLQARKVWDDVEAFIRAPQAPLPSGAPKIPTAPVPPLHGEGGPQGRVGN
jgi:alpha-beta hydrolase superfamily lysophospholipase